jgi:hypothetical protein
VDPGTDPSLPLPTLSPGDSSAARSSGPSGETRTFDIATLKAGALDLDFGDVMVGDGKKSADVFTIKNSGSGDMQLTIEAKGEIKPLIDRIRLGDESLPAVLVAGGESSVAIDLQIPADATPGDYSGTIRVASADGSFSEDIPVTVTVVPEPEEIAPPADDQTVPPVDTGGQEMIQPVPDQPSDPSGDASVQPPTLDPTNDDPAQGSGTDTSGGAADPPSGGSGSSGGDTPPSDPPSDSGSSGGDSSPPAAAGSG